MLAQVVTVWVDVGIPLIGPVIAAGERDRGSASSQQPAASSFLIFLSVFATAARYERGCNIRLEVGLTGGGHPGGGATLRRDAPGDGAQAEPASSACGGMRKAPGGPAPFPGQSL